MKDWDKAYQEGETPWDKGYASPPLAQWLEKNKLKGKGLVLGCGLGHDVRLLSKYCDQVVGIDISQKAIDKAKDIEVVNKESYKVQDFFNLDRNFSQSFDWVVEHTFFCAISPNLRHHYVKNLVKVLRAKGDFLAVFFLKDRSNSTLEGPPYKIDKEAIKEYFGKYFDIIVTDFIISTYLHQFDQNCLYSAQILSHLQQSRFLKGFQYLRLDN